MTELRAWRLEEGITMRPWERRALYAMDRVYRDVCAEKAAAAADGKDGGEPLTTDVFDRMFG